MGAEKWQGSQNKPDWTDVFVMMRAVEAMHGVVVTLCLTPGAFDGPSGFTTLAAYHVPQEASVMGQPVIAMSGEYPCHAHKDLVSCVYAGLYELDTLLGRKLWKQMQLPFTGEGPSA
jgi:hypothetical protein